MFRFFTTWIKTYVFEILALLLGLISFVLLWGEILNPTYIDWIIMDGWDTYQHYIAWEFFRDQALRYPIGVVDAIGYPIGIALMYMDAIPLFAFFFAPFSFLLPDTFQYIGLFLCTSFMLNGLFGYKILSHITKDHWLALMGTIFFILSPVVLFRGAGHASLTAHWLILASLYLILLPQYRVRYWLILELLAILIHLRVRYGGREG